MESCFQFRRIRGRGIALIFFLWGILACSPEKSLLRGHIFDTYPESKVDSLSPTSLQGIPSLKSDQLPLENEFESAWFRIPMQYTVGYQRPAMLLGHCYNIRQVATPTEILYKANVSPHSSRMSAENMRVPYFLLPAVPSDIFIQTVRSPRTGIALDCRELAIDSEAEVINRFMSLQTQEFISGLILIFFGFVAILTFFLYREWLILSFAGLCLSLGGTLLLHNHPLHFLYSNSREIFTLWHLCLTFLASWVYLHFHYLLDQRFLFLKLLAIMNASFAAIYGLLLFCRFQGVEYYSIQYLVFTSLQLIAIGPFVAGRLLYHEAIERRIMGLGVLALVLSMLIDAVGYFFDQSMLMATSIGALVFLLLSVSAAMMYFVQKARSGEKERRVHLEEYNERLEAEVRSRELRLLEKNSLFEQSNIELEEKDTLLRLSYKRMDDLIHQQEVLLRQASIVRSGLLRDLAEGTQELRGEANRVQIQKVSIVAHKLASSLEPFARLYQDIEAVSAKTIWALEAKKSTETFYRHTLGGSKVDFICFQTESELLEKLKDEQPDLLLLGGESISIAKAIHSRFPAIQFIILVTGELAKYIPQLADEPFLNQLLILDEQDPSFSQRNLLVTSTKILSHDIFGLEKYLNWGVDVKERIITGSNDRREAIDQLEKDLQRMGLASSVARTAHRLSDELLMNAIYDAPVDRSTGLSRYNHLPRTVSIELEPSEYARLRYAFDGSILALSIDDPFGGLRRETILRYLKSCFDGKFGSINEAEGKGGGGMGLFQILSSADLLVVNIKPNARTEFIALISANTRSRLKTSGFHYFMEGQD